MGDRAVIGFRESVSSPTLYLYSHWGGSSQELDLVTAIVAAMPRWNDPDYATRICVSQIIGDAWNTETGYGLSVGHFAHPDYDYMNVVDWSTKTINRYELQSDGDWIAVSATPFGDLVAAGSDAAVA